MRKKLSTLWQKIKGLPHRVKAGLFKRQDTLPIIRKLRRRLTAVFLVIMGLILGGVVGFAVRFSAQQLEAAALATFNSDVINAVYDLVYNRDEEIVRANLETLEGKTSSIVYANINGEPLEMNHTTASSSDLDTLYWRALDAVYEEDRIWSAGTSIISAFTVVTSEEAENEETITMDELQEAVAEEGFDIFQGNVLITERGNAVAFSESNGYTANDQVAEDVAGAESAEGVAGEEDLESFALTLNLGGEYLFAKADTDDVVVYGEKNEPYRVVYMDMIYEDNEDYNQDQYIELMVLQPHDANRADYIFMVVGYALLFLGGMAALAVISYLMARLVTKPTARSLQEQAEFIAAASHELKSPLTVMRTSLSAARVAEDGEETEKYQTNAEREAERMSRLVEDLLLLAGGDAGSWKLQSETVEMDTLLIELDEQFAPVAKRAGNTILLRLPDEPLGEVRGDGDRLRQILSVLLDNALQYAPPGTGVVLHAKRHKGQVRLDVIDHGEGIADADKERVFERFYRADASRSDKSHFGLGLSVARELAELHGGSLTLRDTEGGGATFRLSLPAADSRKTDK